MKLIIDIPKEYYETVKNEKSPYFNYLEVKVREGIPFEEHCNNCIYCPTETEDD